MTVVVLERVTDALTYLLTINIWSDNEHSSNIMARLNQ